MLWRGTEEGAKLRIEQKGAETMKYDTAEETGGLDFYGAAEKPEWKENPGAAAWADKRRADARALWAVRVLDACGVAWKNSVPAPIPVYNEPSWVVVLPMHIGAKYGPTPDAARLAAAQAVFESLPAEVKKGLGECP